MNGVRVIESLQEHASLVRDDQPAGSWYVVLVKPRREDFAHRQLVERGVPAYLPRLGLQRHGETLVENPPDARGRVGVLPLTPPATST